MIYTIKKGQHHSNRFPHPLFTKEVRRKVIFDDSAIYVSQTPENQYDINKLFGFTEGFSPHKNSARFGWNWNGALYLYGYVYRNGVRLSQQICSVPLNKEIECIIKAGAEYQFLVLGDDIVGETSIQRAKSGKVLGFALFPYFGGDEVAPHDIRISLR